MGIESQDSSVKLQASKVAQVSATHSNFN